MDTSSPLHFNKYAEKQFADMRPETEKKIKDLIYEVVMGQITLEEAKLQLVEWRVRNE